MYARAITLRKNICLTLAKKYQYKFAYFLLNGKTGVESNQDLVITTKHIIIDTK